MRAGPMRNVVTIERPVQVRTSSGAFREVYEPFLERIAAEVYYINGSEPWINPQILAESDVRIRIRHRGAITAKMRVTQQVEPGSPTKVVVFDIGNVQPTDRRRVEMFLWCKLRDAQGFRRGEESGATPPPIPGNSPTADSTVITVDSDLYTADQENTI